MPPLVVDDGSEILSHSFADYEWLEKQMYRLHEFGHPNIPSPVTGLTADILISVALIGYYGLNEEEDAAGLGDPGGPKRLGYVRSAQGQMSWKEIVRVALASYGQLGLTDQRSSAT